MRLCKYRKVLYCLNSVTVLILRFKNQAFLDSGNHKAASNFMVFLFCNFRRFCPWYSEYNLFPQSLFVVIRSGNITMVHSRTRMVPVFCWNVLCLVLSTSQLFCELFLEYSEKRHPLTSISLLARSAFLGKYID